MYDKDNDQQNAGQQPSAQEGSTQSNEQNTSVEKPAEASSGSEQSRGGNTSGEGGAA